MTIVQSQPETTKKRQSGSLGWFVLLSLIAHGLGIWLWSSKLRSPVQPPEPQASTPIDFVVVPPEETPVEVPPETKVTANNDSVAKGEVKPKSPSQDARGATKTAPVAPPPTPQPFVEPQPQIVEEPPPKVTQPEQPPVAEESPPIQETQPEIKPLPNLSKPALKEKAPLAKVPEIAQPEPESEQPSTITEQTPVVEKPPKVQETQPEIKPLPNISKPVLKKPAPIAKAPEPVPAQEVPAPTPTESAIAANSATPKPKPQPKEPPSAGVASLLGTESRSLAEHGNDFFFPNSQNPSQQALNPGGIDARRNPNFADYFAKIRRRVRRNWRPSSPGEDKNTVLVFSIQRNGQISDLRILRSSGSSKVDQESLAAVQNSAPFPALPADFPQPQLNLEFNFNIYTNPRDWQRGLHDW